MSLVFGRTKKGLVEIEVKSISSWDGFENIVHFLEQEFKARVLEKHDGPDARTWILEIQGQIIIVQHLDTFGNCFFSDSAEGEKIVIEIGNRLQERLKKYN